MQYVSDKTYQLFTLYLCFRDVTSSGVVATGGREGVWLLFWLLGGVRLATLACLAFGGDGGAGWDTGVRLHLWSWGACLVHLAFIFILVRMLHGVHKTSET
jgi:hypothetical protein